MTPVIQKFKQTDYDAVVALLTSQNVEPPKEPSELRGCCFVAKPPVSPGDLGRDKVVGVIYALCGESSKAYVDYLAISPEYHATMLFYKLIKTVEIYLKKHGVNRYVFNVEKHNHQMIQQLFKYRAKYGIVKLNDLHYFSREI